MNKLFDGTGLSQFLGQIYVKTRRPAPGPEHGFLLGFHTLSATASAQPEASTKLFVYAKLGQTRQETNRDQYEFHLWSATEIDYDPTYTNQPLANLADCNRAMGACLEGFGYKVK